jgi:hypothetical protein
VNLQELALREATLKALADTVDKHLKTARIAYQDALAEAEKTTGATVGNVVPTLPDGTPIATVYTRGSGEPEARVDNMAAVVKWAIVNAPTEIKRELVTTVREAYLNKILDEMTNARTNLIVDHNGVVHTIDGVSVKPRRSKTHSVRFKDGGHQAILAAWRQGTVDIPGVSRPELET